MPQNSRNVFYPEPVSMATATVAPRLITADVTVPSVPFSFEGAMHAFAALNVHEYLTTALTGANNDLNFFARKPGSTNITIEYRDPSANNAALSVTVQEYLTTALAGNNNDLVWRAVAEGSTNITIVYVDPAANDAVEAVVVTGDATTGWTITVNLATGVAGAITSTGDTIKASILASAAASALVTVVDAASNDGSGAVTALAATALDGQDIIVHLGTGAAGAITTTAALLKAAIDADVLASAAVIVENAASNTGAGLVIALAKTALAGPAGTNPTLDVKLKHGILGQSGSNVMGDHGTSFTQATAAGSEFKAFANVAPLGEWVFDIGGTNTPIFAASIDVWYRP